MLYLVISGHHDEPYTPERNACDMTWAGTVRDIADVQFEHLRQVLEIGTGQDVTVQILREALHLRAVERADYSHAMFKLTELHIGTLAARSLVREMA